MPNKYAQKKGWQVPKQQYKITNWSDYNQSLRNRGSIELWVSEEVINNWYEEERIYDGTGCPKIFTDLAIITCYEIRQVFKLPLRQCQGFIDSIFKAKNIDCCSPDYSCLSKRLAFLKLSSPRYKKTDSPDEEIAGIAIDSTGLKRFGRGEWHQAKYAISAKRSWRKLHIAVDTKHIIQGCELTDRFVSDSQTIEPLAKQVSHCVDQVAADGVYDKWPVYDILTEYFKGAVITIPPGSEAIYNKSNHPQRNRNLQEIKTFGRMAWQKVRNYGFRNYSELCIQRYKKNIGQPASRERIITTKK